MQSVRFVSLFLSFLALSLQLSAKLPEVPVVFYGQLSHQVTEPLIPLSENLIEVVAKLDGVEVASAYVSSGSDSYSLKLPMDDGQEPRLNGHVRGGERVRIYLRNQGESLEVEAIQSASQSGFPVSELRGDFVLQNLVVADDMGGATGLELAFAEWAEEEGLDTSDVQAAMVLDSDGDGHSNEEEFIAQTDPNSSVSVFAVFELQVVFDSTFIRFGPVAPDRRYTIWSNTDLSNPNGWSIEGSIEPGYSSDSFWFGLSLSPDAKTYRVEVQLKP